MPDSIELNKAMCPWSLLHLQLRTSFARMERERSFPFSWTKWVVASNQGKSESIGIAEAMCPWRLLQSQWRTSHAWRTQWIQWITMGRNNDTMIVAMTVSFRGAGIRWFRISCTVTVSFYGTSTVTVQWPSQWPLQWLLVFMVLPTVTVTNSESSSKRTLNSERSL